ncbi:NAD-dependent deacylase [uncultured Maribacter sp.]|uniref:SIR2 family NAD-dependent protein deacylase n=1 Tax=uncultured Maribacter sp. TaxID=431308 RepID=UPI0030D6F40C|tara:strand:- start:4428 stop:5114 length:687 start_codon:yes stop_codon:yes gene_type:complete
MKNIVVLTGAGISAESGLKTFRDANGLWEGHDVMEVASQQGFYNNPQLVLEFYNQRRRQLLSVHPNKAHLALVELEKHYNVHIVTQNVDDLHERAGSSHVLHLHGELLKARSMASTDDVFVCNKDIRLGDKCKKGYQIRPHIVWFGEAVPLLEDAMNITEKADYLIIIGTSMQVYPAASLIDFAKANTPIFFIDPKPAIKAVHNSNLTVISENAVKGVPTLVASLIGK